MKNSINIAEEDKKARSNSAGPLPAGSLSRSPAGESRGAEPPAFPVNLRISGRSAVVVGGGAVALRKVRSLLEGGASVRVVAPELHPALRALADSGGFEWLARPYGRSDLEGAFIAFAATRDREVNGEVAEDAERLRVLCCVADLPSSGSFTSPSVLRRGDLLLTVSTGGNFPPLAQKIRDDLAARYGEEWGDAVALLGFLREKLLTANGGAAYNEKLFRSLSEIDWGALPAEKRPEKIDGILLALLGPGYSLESLKRKD